MNRLKRTILTLTVLSFITLLMIPSSYSNSDHNNSLPEAFKLESAHFYSAKRLVAAISNGETTSLELLNHFLDRIEQYNGEINAVVAINAEAARERAKEADEALERGENWGPLHGLPMTIKDTTEVAGMPTTSGDPELAEYIPEKNAIAVQRLIDAGAIIFGKTNVPYYAGDYQSYNRVYGTTNNPWDLSRTPGGSSGGSAAAIAAGFAPLELGSDVGGSIRIPCHFTGIFGHKPSFGIVPRYGHIPPMPGEVSSELMPSIPLFVLGPMGRDVEDLELALDVLITPNTSADQTPALLPPRRENFEDYRVAVWITDPPGNVDDEILDRMMVDDEISDKMMAMVENLRQAGIEIDDNARPDIDMREEHELFISLYTFFDTESPEISYDELMQWQDEQEAKWATFFESYDILVMPVSQTVAFPHNSESLVVNGKKKPYNNIAYWSTMAVTSGLPVTVVPIGFSDSGLPIGVQIVGPHLEDKTTLDFARRVSEIIGGYSPPPDYTK